MPNPGCGDIQRLKHRKPGESVGGPSLRLFGSLPIFKARRQVNKCLESEDSAILVVEEGNEDETSVSVSGPSRVASGRATAASAPGHHSTARRSSPLKLKPRKSPPSLPPLPPPACGRLHNKRLRDSDKAVPIGYGARILSEVKKLSHALPPQLGQSTPKPALIPRNQTVPKPARKPPPQPPPPQVHLLKQETFQTNLLETQPHEKSRRMRLPKFEPKSLQEGPINYMQVYHRLRKGRFGFLYDYPAFGATSSSSPARNIGRSGSVRGQMSQLRLQKDKASVVAANSVSAFTPCTSPEMTASKSKVIADVTISPSSDSNTTNTCRTVDTSLSHHTLRLLRDKRESEGRATAPGAASTVIATEKEAALSKFYPLRPVPKPRKPNSLDSTSARTGPAFGAGMTYAIAGPPICEINSDQTSTTGAGVTSVVEPDVRSPVGGSQTPGPGITSVMGAGVTSPVMPTVAAAPSSAKQPTRRQSAPLSVATFSSSYFASASLCSLEPFGPPRLHCVSPMLVAPSAALEPASVDSRRIRYRCVDFQALQRLSVTSLLLGKDDPAARCQWLGSAALLTHLRFPTQVELPARVGLAKGDTKCAAGTFTHHQDAKMDLSISIDPVEARFAFTAMRRRRASRVRLGLGGANGGTAKSAKAAKSNLYAVPVG